MRWFLRRFELSDRLHFTRPMRRLQFSLRTILVITTLVAAACVVGPAVWPYRDGLAGMIAAICFLGAVAAALRIRTDRSRDRS